MNNIGQIKNHQSRVIEADSWEEYCKAFEEYKGEPVGFKSLTKMIGDTIPKAVDITNLIYDEYHLSCDIWNGMFKTKKLAYLCEQPVNRSGNRQNRE